MESIFDSPILALKFDPFLCPQILSAGDDMNGFRLSSCRLAMKLTNLSGCREADLLGSDRVGAQGTYFLTSTIFFIGSGCILRCGSRGKIPPEWRSSEFGEFLGSLFGYP